MLAVSPLRDPIKDEKQGEMATNFSIVTADNGFPDFGDANLLDTIDFDDLFIGIGDGDVLPDLEMDPEILAEFSSSNAAEECSDVNTSASVEKSADADQNSTAKRAADEDDDKVSGGSGLVHSSPSGEEIVSKQREEANPAPAAGKEAEKGGRKTSASGSAQSKNSQGKRKVKVDWTPELHRRFVQAVEQLGVDKAVPSRILEIMGIDCLTRHNIASHLQKYRSHRKHLLAREAEAASWTQRRQMYGTSAPPGGKREVSPWAAAVAEPTMGFPPMTRPPPMHHPHHFRPLHVWGHPTVDQSLMHVWPPTKQHPAWAPPPPLDPSYWHSHHQRVPSTVTAGTPCFPQPRYGSGAAVAAGIPPAAPNYSVFDILPSKESIDAAIGDVLAKPWLPLPLGLKPPTTDSVMGELQRQGVPNVPPSCA